MKNLMLTLFFLTGPPILILLFFCILKYWKQLCLICYRVWISIYRWAKYNLNYAVISTLFLTVLVLLTCLLGGIASFRSKPNDWPNAILSGIKTAISVLAGNDDTLYTVYPHHSAIIFILYVTIPVLTASTVIFFIVDFCPKPLPRKKEFFIFAQVNERSILLAEDISRNHCSESIGIIFLRAKWDMLQAEDAVRLKKINARLYPYIESELLEIHCLMKWKKIRFFFISADTDNNFKQIKAFLESVSQKKLFSRPPRFSEDLARKEEMRSVFQQEIYLMSETESAPILIDQLRQMLCEFDVCQPRGIKKKTVFAHTDLRLLDRYQTVIYRLFYEKPLYETADGKSIRVLILGFGRVGQEFFRAAGSFCAMAGYTTSFWLCDKKINEQWGPFLMQYPECKRDLWVSSQKMDVELKELLEFLEKQMEEEKPVTYIVLSLGDDERNIRIATRLKRFYRKCYWQNSQTLLPTICVNLEDNIKSEYVSLFLQNDVLPKKEHQSPDIPLHVFGSDKDTFSKKMLLNRGLWTAAQRVHVKLKSGNLSYWQEYDRRSSIACAAHAPYHMKALTEEFGKSVDPQTLEQEVLKNYIDSEHRRWMDFARFDGMQKVDVTTVQNYKGIIGSHVDVAAKLTPCLVPTDELNTLYTELYPFDAELKHSFMKRDEMVVRNATELCRMISESNYVKDLSG